MTRFSPNCFAANPAGTLRAIAQQTIDSGEESDLGVGHGELALNVRK